MFFKNNFCSSLNTILEKNIKNPYTFVLSIPYKTNEIAHGIYDFQMAEYQLKNLLLLISSLSPCLLLLRI